MGNKGEMPVKVFGIQYGSVHEAYKNLPFPYSYSSLCRAVKNAENKGKVLEGILLKYYPEGKLTAFGIPFKTLEEVYEVDPSKSGVNP